MPDVTLLLRCTTEMTEALDSSSVRLRHRHGMIIAASLAMSGMALSILLVTGPQFGMVWDESFTVKREQLLNQWFEKYVTQADSAQRRRGFTKLVLDRYWLFSREEPHGHPPFYALIGLAGWKLGQHWLSPLGAYRFGPMLLTSITVGVIYYHLATRRGHLAGGVAAVLLLAMPRSFAHAHYAHYDMPMTCLWLIAQVAFAASLESLWWAAPFGLALGLAAATKFTGFFAVLPAVVWVAVFEIPKLLPTRGAGRTGATSLLGPGLRSLSVGAPGRADNNVCDPAGVVDRAACGAPTIFHVESFASDDAARSDPLPWCVLRFRSSLAQHHRAYHDHDPRARPDLECDRDCGLLVRPAPAALDLDLASELVDVDDRSPPSRTHQVTTVSVCFCRALRAWRSLPGSELAGSARGAGPVGSGSLPLCSSWPRSVNASSASRDFILTQTPTTTAPSEA